MIASNGGDAAAFWARGTAYDRLGYTAEALADYTSVLALDPDHFNAAYARAGKWSTAPAAPPLRPQVEYSTRSAPAATPARLRGDAVLTAKHTPPDPAACHNRAGRFAEAIDDYNLALAKDAAATAAAQGGGILGASGGGVASRRAALRE